MNTVQYQVYSIKYERLNDEGKREKISEDFYLREEERDYIFNNGSSKIFLNIYPADGKCLFHEWNLPKHLIKTKHTYLCKEPTEERKQTENLTAEDYKIKEIFIK